jgi:hypothetical protein
MLQAESQFPKRVVDVEPTEDGLSDADIYRTYVTYPLRIVVDTVHHARYFAVLDAENQLVGDAYARGQNQVAMQAFLDLCYLMTKPEGEK